MAGVRALTVRHHAARADVALGALQFMLGWPGGWVPMFVTGGPEAWEFWERPGAAGAGERVAARVRWLDEEYSAECALGMGRPSFGFGTTTRVGCLWVVVSGGDQNDRLRRFRPYPSMVLREGGSSRRTALWLLERPLHYADALRANKRIAYRLRAVQKHADPDGFVVPCPGSFLRAGRARPVPIIVTRLVADSWRSRDLVGRLKDPPVADGWRKAVDS